MTDTTPTPSVAARHAAAVSEAQIRRDQAREAIIERARSLARRLERVAANLERDPEAIISGSGEVQADGCHIDTACAQLETNRALLRVLRTGNPHG